MTTEKILENVFEIKALLNNDNLCDCNINIENLINMLQDDIRKQDAKKQGRSSELSACKKLLKECYNKSLQYPIYTDDLYGNTLQCITNSYLIIVYNKDNHIQLENAPDDTQQIYVDKILKDYNSTDTHNIDTIDLKALKSYIKIDKAEHKRDKNHNTMYILNDGDSYGYNAFYIEQCMVALGSKDIAMSILNNQAPTMKLESNKGYAYILPIMIREKTENVKATKL